MIVAAAATVLAVHAVASLAEVRPLVLVSGIPLAFYVPGGLLVWAASPGPFIRIAGPIERQALSVVLSVAIISIVALLLDLTPAGITSTSLTVAVGCLIPLALLIRWGMVRLVVR